MSGSPAFNRSKSASTQQRGRSIGAVQHSVEPEAIGPTMWSTNDMELIMQRIRNTPSEETGHATHVTFLDMGGQSEFWSIVGSFLRNNAVISVFGRLDDLLESIDNNRHLSNDPDKDSDLLAFDELLMWLDVITACTSEGPVLLAMSRADKVPDLAAQRRISQAIWKRLAAREHPILARLVSPTHVEGLIFFPLDNMCGLAGDGVMPYRAMLLELTEKSKSARQIVPISLLKFQARQFVYSSTAWDDFCLSDANSLLFRGVCCDLHNSIDLSMTTLHGLNCCSSAKTTRGSCFYDHRLLPL